MENRDAWLNWINDQLEDMYSNDTYTDIGTNRVFKTLEDDRDIASHILEKLKELMEEE